ncbi:TetR family transcriptional regulator [Amycolatopsis antarctica]|uniref:TetR family transcriptional regulator n=1 Tax=Amycolatopsis antarctica TaxID=1854586 RepID=A0A263D7V5_9PSEU|nr:TetR/AcrR family transcriptional regulator [Amycolatopsis antarctica]OZM73637.1 TetR family transcriptional regulator [Amycolatopsis antarctica]
MSETMASLTPAAERILRVAAELFYDNGIHAVGVELIASTAGVTKKTLYDRFGSKDTLVGMYLTRRDENWREHVRHTVERGTRVAPARRPLLVFDALEQWMAERTPRGCAFVNAHAELPDGDHPGRQAIAAQKRWMLDYLRDLVREAGLRNPRKLAGALLLLLEGATVTAPIGVLPDAVAAARELAKGLLDAAR